LLGYYILFISGNQTFDVAANVADYGGQSNDAPHPIRVIEVESCPTGLLT
jgi:hypothetical protein